MDLSLYPMIFKRKSFHLFRNVGNETLTESEVNEIYSAYNSFIPLIPDIKTEIKIVPSSETNCRCGQEYCILLYSEKKDNYLSNIGYLGQQLDLYLVSKNIGTLWCGLAKTEETSYHGLAYVIMIAIRKISDPTKYRQDMFKIKRKTAKEIWTGPEITGVTDIVRFAPSACNSQPWSVENRGTSLLVYRCKLHGLLGIMSGSLASYCNRIDMGIFLCYIDICMENAGICYDRSLYIDPGENQDRTLLAEYTFETEGASK